MIDPRALPAILIGLALGGAGCRAGDPPHRSSVSVQINDQDTAPPPVPPDWPEVLDSTVTVAPPDDPSVLYFRHRYGIAFETGTSGPAIRELLARYRATIVGGEPAIGPQGAYIVSVPDPGPTYEAVSTLEARLAAEPGVALVYIESYRGKGVLRDRRSGTS